MAKTRGARRRAVQVTGNRSGYRLMEILLTVRSVIWWCLMGLYRAWKLNPISLFRHRMRTMYRLDAQNDLPIKPKWTERVKDLFISDVQRKIRLLQWVRTRVNHVSVEDFIYSWQDGIALCALLESVCPGVCPRFYLLKSDLRVNNCRFGLQIAHQFLGIQRTILSPEEMAIADQDTELKIVHLVQMIRWKTQRMSKSASIEPPVVTMPTRRVLSRCFARGAGLKAGMVGRRAKFNIFTDCNGVLDILVEIRGPNGEMNSEKITSLHPEVTTDSPTDNNTLKPPNLEPRSKVISDDHGNTFRRQKSFDEDTIEVIPFDYQSVGEGRFLASYVPRNPGIHTLVIKSHDHHIQGSPFEVSVSNWTSSWNIVGKSKLKAMSMLPSIDESPSRKKQLEAAVSSRFLEAASQRARRHRGSSSKQLTVSKRRVLKRVMTRNGEEIVLSDYTPSPTLSRQSSADLSDLSEEEQNKKESQYSDSNVLFVNPQQKVRKDSNGSQKHLIKLPVKDEIYVPRDETSYDTSDSFSPISVDSSSIAYDSHSSQGSHIGRQSDNELSNTKNSESRTQTEFTKTPVHRSFSESFAMDMELVQREECDVTELKKTEGHENNSPPLKLLQSESLKKACFYISNKPVLESIGTLNTPSNASTDTPVAVVVRPRPKLAQIQKMSRKCQSFDDAAASEDPLAVSSSTSQISDASQNTSSSEWSLSGTRSLSELQNSEVVGSHGPSIENLGSTGGENRDSPEKQRSSDKTPSQYISATFCSIVDKNSSPEHKWNNSQTSIVTPKVKTDRTTQVSAEEIKQETGWHSGAFRIKKRRICLNRGHIKLYGHDVAIDPGESFKGEEFGKMGTGFNNCSDSGEQGIQEAHNQNDPGEQGQGRRGRDQCNVRDWLLNIGRDRFSVSADRQSTSDTNDSGIADETLSSLYHKNGHQRIFRRSYTWEIPLDSGLVKESVDNHNYTGRYPRGSSFATLADHWPGFTISKPPSEGLSLSDSELEYGEITLVKRNRSRLKCKSRWIHGISENFKLEKEGEKGTEESGKVFSESSARSTQPPEVNIKTSGKNSQLSKCRVSFSMDISDDKESFNVSNHQECRSRSQRSSLTSQNAVDETCDSDSPLHDTLTQDACRVNSPECLQVGNGETADNEIPDDGTASGVAPVPFNLQTDTDAPSADIRTDCAHLSQPDACTDNNSDSSRKSTDDISLDVLYDTYFTSGQIKALEDLIKNNPFTETDERRDRLPGDTEEGEDCLVFGSGLTYGHVGITNNFQVWVRHPTNGGVSVSIYGPKPHCVTETTTTYTGDSLYEVMYVVTQPGNYIIFVKWCDQNLPNSPFIAKIAWDD